MQATPAFTPCPETFFARNCSLILESKQTPADTERPALARGVEAVGRNASREVGEARLALDLVQTVQQP